MIKKKINYVQSDPKVTASMLVAGGGIATQSYNAASGEYYPERSLVPLVLTPKIGYSLPDTGESSDDANALLTDGHWYRLDGTNPAGIGTVNEISNNMPLTGAPGAATDRFAIETTTGKSTYGQLTIYENTTVDKPVTYVFVATLNVGKPRKVTCAYRSRCRAVTVLPELFFDNATNALYNPLEDPDQFVITPKISPASLPATFSWETMHNDTWGALDSTLFDWAIRVDAATGKLTILRNQMQEEVNLRCTATVTVDDAQVQVRQVVKHTRRIPKFDFDIYAVGNLNEGTKTINPRAMIKMGKRVLADPTAELLVAWYGSGTTPIAYGMNPSIAMSLLGTASELGLDVTDRGGWKALTTADGKVLTTADGKVLIAK